MAPEERKILIFDFGGGTFDVTVLIVGGGINEVRSTSGDTQLGGQDLDVKLVEYCLEEFKNKTGIDISKEKTAFHKLRVNCERAKRRLSTETETEILVMNLAQQKDFELTITRAKFEQICDSVFKKLMVPV